MRVVVLALLVAFASSPASAAEEPVGSFACLYGGTWHCGPDRFCIDSGVPQPSRFTLQVNFDSKPFPRIRLNGLDGQVERNGDGQWFVYWHLGGLGNPKFSTSFSEDGGLRATFISAHPNGGSESSNFKCTRATKPVL
jgi:hypothetical protein